MTRTFTYQIQSDAQTVQQFLSAQGFSRQTIISLKKQPDGIVLNGTPVYTNHPLSRYDTLTVTLKEPLSSEKILPVPIPLDIVYEDEDILVLNKPADMPVHPSLHNYNNTLANGVAFYYQSQNTPFIFRCINRLDRDTTGLTIIAKNQFSAGVLSERMSRREIRREYLAIVDGIDLPDRGVIDAPIARVNGSAIERQVDFVCGERAITHYQTECKRPENNLTLIRLWLETGRTHQIRVHMKYIGHPLAGDFLYHPNKEHQKISRQALHARKLIFHHPVTGKLLIFEAPIPQDMLSLLQ
ncbi:MAG: RluA family pseudouridine synthase [Lachnospiraceae bacterium]|nr:RluA family pseudouridine synthase [Lachnospiraceae bacterium]